MKNITRILSAALALCLLAALCLPRGRTGRRTAARSCWPSRLTTGPANIPARFWTALPSAAFTRRFFVNGVNASGWPETLKRIVNEGHQLANHTYNHKNLNTCSAQTVAYEISAVQALITAAGGDENAYIRAPLRQREQNGQIRRDRAADLLVGRPGRLEVPQCRDGAQQYRSRCL